MKAYRENVNEMIDLLSVRLPTGGDAEAAVWDEVMEFLRECGDWLPPKRDYDRVAEHRAAKEKEPT